MTQADPYKYFRIEAKELLDELVANVEALKKGWSLEAINRILRVSHTLKGAARVVRLGAIADQAHAVEQAIAPLREIEAPIDPALLRSILSRIDGMVGLLPGAPPAAPALEPTAAAPRADGALDEVFRTVRTDVAEMTAIVDGVREVSAELVRFRRAIDSARDRGELPSALERTLSTGLQQVERELDQVRSAAELMRLVPVASLFPSLGRLARDLGRAVGRAVGFEGVGGQVRLQSELVAQVHQALVQMVRNAVAHGIESDAERTGAGKPATGTITIEVESDGDRVLFRCRDDGRGVDLAAVEQALRRKGALDAASPVTPDALLRKLVETPVTTARAPTEIAGRGVGLDVVREIARELGGSVQLTTEAGSGTCVTISVPVAVAALEALQVRAGGAMVAIPTAAVRSAFVGRTRDIVTVGDHELVAADGEQLPFARLDRLMGWDSPAASANPNWSGVVVEAGARRAVVGVDHLVGITSIVVRPVPSEAFVLPIVSGVALDAVGTPQVVVDAETMVGEASRLPARAADPPVERLPVLVVDDSLTTRMLEKSILESAGYTVDIATSGEEAMEKIANKRYGLFLVDVEMPGMDGFTFVERTRADPAQASIPAILVTSRNSDDDKRRGEAAGASAYIVKGAFDQVALLDRIKELLG